MHRLAAILSAFILASCTPVLEGANPAGGIVITNFDHEGALQLADHHCQMFGKHSRVRDISRQSHEIAFDCV